MRRLTAAAVAARLRHVRGPAPADFTVSLAGSTVAVRGEVGAGRVGLDIAGTAYAAALRWTPGPLTVRLQDGDGAAEVTVVRCSGGYRLGLDGRWFFAAVRSPREAELFGYMPAAAKPAMAKALLSPMPGVLVSVAVVVGQRVRAGAPLAVVEAMKMQNVLVAACDVAVAAIKAKPGESLARGAVILEFC